MKAPAADVDEPAGRREPAGLTTNADRLVERARGQERHERAGRDQEDASRPVPP
jgi:hypothetical protein